MRRIDAAQTSSAFVFLAFLLNIIVGPALIFLSALVWCGYLSIHRRIVLPAGWPARLVIAFAVPAYAMLSLCWSVHPDSTFKQAMWLLATVLLACATAYSTSANQFRFVTLVLTLSLCVLSVVFNRPYFDAEAGILSYGGIFANKNILAYTATLLGLSAGSFGLDDRVRSGGRVAAATAAVFAGAVAYLARSIAVDVILTVAAGALLLLRYVHRRPARFRASSLAVMLAVAAVTVGPLALAVMNNLDAALGLVSKDPSLTGRTDLWDYAIRAIDANPWAGTGYQAFWIRGDAEPEYLWDIMHVEGRMGFHFHNTLLNTGVELGLPGLALAATTLLGFVLVTFRSALTTGVDGAYAAVTMLFVACYEQQASDLFQPFNPVYFATLVVFLQAPTSPVQHGFARALRSA